MLAARPTPDDGEALQKEVEGIARSLAITRKREERKGRLRLATAAGFCFDERSGRLPMHPDGGAKTMSSFLSLADAQVRLTEVVENMIPGEKLFLTVNDYPIAELVRTAYLPTTEPRKPGSAIGKIFILEEDDSHLDDFKEYME